MELQQSSRVNVEPLRMLRRAPASSSVDAGAIAELLAECAMPGETLIVGLTGSVAAGKTTLCTAITAQLQSTLHVETVSTDGFLLPNDVLAARDLTMKKGYPESYDLCLMSGALQRVRLGPVRFPGYSHRTYDLAPDLDRTISRPDILLVEGLGLSPAPGGRDPRTLLDLLIYVDASEPDLETWFVSRFMQYWRAAENDPSSFYTRFRSLDAENAEAMARMVWTQINLPNLRENIVRARDAADLVIAKSLDHSLRLVS